MTSAILRRPRTRHLPGTITGKRGIRLLPGTVSDVVPAARNFPATLPARKPDIYHLN